MIQNVDTQTMGETDVFLGYFAGAEQNHSVTGMDTVYTVGMEVF